MGNKPQKFKSNKINLNKEKVIKVNESPKIGEESKAKNNIIYEKNNIKESPQKNNENICDNKPPEKKQENTVLNLNKMSQNQKSIISSKCEEDEYLGEIVKHKINEKQIEEIERIIKEKGVEFSEFNYMRNDEVDSLNTKITLFLQSKSYDIIPEEEEEENRVLGYFLKGVEIISKKAQNDALQIIHYYKYLFKKYYEKQKEIIIKEYVEYRFFSSWVKQYYNDKDNFLMEKEKNKIKYILYEEKIFLDKKSYDILKNLYQMLVKLYVFCEVSIPKVYLIYSIADNKFNSKSMIDIYNAPNRNKKIDFTYLPGLFSNGNYLKNGKNYVFTYKNNTFSFAKTNNKKIKEKNDYNIFNK